MPGVKERSEKQASALGFAIERVRATQRLWQTTELRTRLRMIRQVRSELARSAYLLVEAFPAELRARPAERLASEIIPLAEACRFLEQNAESILSPVRIARRNPSFWLRGIEIEERRDPYGVIFVIGPANYPLFLPGVQALQALVAGNAVVLKPGTGGGRVIAVFKELLRRAGIADDLLMILEEDIALVRAVLEAGVDKVVFTGSYEAGRAVYRLAADAVTPIILELTGSDPVFVLQGADLDRAVDAVAFGLRWNGGNTCIAPRRIFVAESEAELFGVLLDMKCPEAAGLLPVVRFQDEAEALELASQSRFALGASVFGKREAACAFARKVRAGLVVVNDMIMPTADPRVAFGGRDRSGFGKTRGAAGLLEMTVTKAVVAQEARRLRHLEPLTPSAAELFSAYANIAHAAPWGARLRAVPRLMRARRPAKRRQV
jgi:acyl-CoA reductase-like NAD-dependent aldehyde dehydrogenase